LRLGGGEGRKVLRGTTLSKRESFAVPFHPGDDRVAERVSVNDAMKGGERLEIGSLVEGFPHKDWCVRIEKGGLKEK